MEWVIFIKSYNQKASIESVIIINKTTKIGWIITMIDKIIIIINKIIIMNNKIEIMINKIITKNNKKDKINRFLHV